MKKPEPKPGQLWQVDTFVRGLTPTKPCFLILKHWKDSPDAAKKQMTLAFPIEQYVDVLNENGEVIMLRVIWIHRNASLVME